MPQKRSAGNNGGSWFGPSSNDVPEIMFRIVNAPIVAESLELKLRGDVGSRDGSASSKISRPWGRIWRISKPARTT